MFYFGYTTPLSPTLQKIEESLVLRGGLLDEWVDLGQQVAALEARRAELLATRLDLLAQERSLDPGSDEMALRSMCAEYEQQILPFAENDTAARTRTHARGIAARVHPEGMAEQHRRGRSERAVTVKPDGDGMAVLTAILPELLAYAIHDRITSMADEVTRARPEGQRRPRRSTLAKIRAEREAALGMQTPHDPEPPAHPGAAFLDALDDPAPWEDDSVSCDEREAEAAEQMAEREHAAHAAAESFNLAPLIDESDLLDESDILGEAGSLGEAGFVESTPMHDGYGALEHDTRTTDQLRADIFADLLLTTSPTSITSTSLESVKATVQVTIGASTLVGADDAMGELNGHGPIAPDAVRLLAGQAGSWERAFLDARGMVVETDNYVPTAGMKRYLRARDQHCRFPGCRTPAHWCQIDHNHDHAKGGPTALSNLSLFCTSHHPLKHPDVDDRDRWTAKQLDDGVVLWTSPLGRTYTDEPPLRVMFT